MRPFIMRELRKVRGTKPEDAIRQALRGNNLEQFVRSLRKSGGIAEAIDVNDFPHIVRLNPDAFRSYRDKNSNFVNKLADVQEGRNEDAHPPSGDFDRSWSFTRISIIAEVLEIIGASAQKAKVEEIRDTLLTPPSEAGPIPPQEPEPTPPSPAPEASPSPPEPEAPQPASGHSPVGAGQPNLPGVKWTGGDGPLGRPTRIRHRR